MGIVYSDPDIYFSNSNFNLPPDDGMKGFLYKLTGIIILVIICLLLGSCSTTKYVPVETVRIEYRNHTDTVKQTDSVFKEKETIIREADSSLVAKLGLQLKDNKRAILILQKELERQVREKEEHSTDTVIKTDSVQVPYPIERNLTKWESLKMDMGGIAIGGCVVFILIIVVYFLVRAHRKT